jgi:hypothetical protein
MSSSGGEKEPESIDNFVRGWKSGVAPSRPGQIYQSTQGTFNVGSRGTRIFET